MSDEINPFESPQTTSAPMRADAGPDGARWVVPFESGHARAMWAVALLAIVMVVDVVGAGSTYMEIQLLNRARSGKLPSPDEVDGNEARQGAVGFCQVVVAIASAVTFLMWFHRVHRNLPALGNQYLKYSPGWAVGAWFIPILNLFRPCQIMAEVWRGSVPRTSDVHSEDSRHVSVSPIVGWWWAFWIIMGIANQAAFRLASRAETLETVWTASWADFYGDLLSLPAGLLAIMVVRGVDTNQEQRHQVLQRQAGTTPFAPDYSPYL